MRFPFYLLVLAVLLGGAIPPAAGQIPEPAATTDAGPPVASPQEIEQRNFRFMFFGFLAAWLILGGYVVALVVRERKIGSEIERLRKMIEDREHKA